MYLSEHNISNKEIKNNFKIIYILIVKLQKILYNCSDIIYKSQIKYEILHKEGKFMIASPHSRDIDLKDILSDVEKANIQLPEFQRSWTWDDNRIRELLASLSRGYPMGAIMQLEYGNPDIKFGYRPIEFVNNHNVFPSYLILDGQQRITSMYLATYSNQPVKTKDATGKKIERYYYLDINKCLDEKEDRVDAIVAVPKDKKQKINFDRDVILDLSSRELEYKNEMFPLNIIFGDNEFYDWADGYKEFYNYSQEAKDRYNKFRSDVLDTIKNYRLPVITLDKDTPKEAVCKVFENVNTGGVSLTVFELVTAMFATYEINGKAFNLRNDWDKCKNIIWGVDEQLNTDVMKGVDETSFLTTVTLYTTYSKPGATTCKKKDVLKLSFEDYQRNKNEILEGFKMAKKFLFSQYVFRKRDLPYQTQLIPLSAICAFIGKSKFDSPRTQKILERWYWCGIMGEMYGGSNESRYANDMEDIIALINHEESLNRTINASSFSSTRLLTLQTRLSAAYKGIMALIYKEGCRDFVKGSAMDVVKSMDESSDIHHVFPENYCRKKNYDKEKWNSIVNKTPLLSPSNRSIGGDAPSKYCEKIKKIAQIDDEELRKRVESHLIDYSMLKSDSFKNYFIDRAKKLLRLIEMATDKTISDKASEEVINKFGCSLN